MEPQRVYKFGRENLLVLHLGGSQPQKYRTRVEVSREEMTVTVEMPYPLVERYQRAR
jgi:hypothetical protein